MDDDSLNGGDAKSSALSMEEEEELEEDGVSLTTTSSSAAASPPPQPPPAHPLPSNRGRPPSRPPSEEADQPAIKSTVGKSRIAPTPPPPQQQATANMAAVKRRREIEQDELIIIPGASRPSPPAQLTVPGLPTQHPLLSADLLHSLQYFALLRQSIPNGKLTPFFSSFPFAIVIHLFERIVWVTRTGGTCFPVHFFFLFFLS